MRKVLAMVNRGLLAEADTEGDADQYDLFVDPETNSLKAFRRDDPNNPKPTKPRPPHPKPGGPQNG